MLVSELFGPILPIVPVKVREAVAQVERILAEGFLLRACKTPSTGRTHVLTHWRSMRLLMTPSSRSTVSWIGGEAMPDRSRRLILHAIVFNNTQSGQFVVNDTGIQAAIQTLPFGGVGESGCTSFFNI